MTTQLPPKQEKKNTQEVKTGPVDINPTSLNRSKRITLPSYNDVPKVKGIFRNVEFPGTGITFPFRGGWKGPIKQFTMFDGLEYEIPKELADHLNNNCAYKTMKWVAADGTETVNARPITTPGMPNYTPKINKKIHRFMFQITG